MSPPQCLNLLALLFAQLIEKQLLNVVLIVLITVLFRVPATIKFDKGLPLLPQLPRRPRHPHSLREDVTGLEDRRRDIAALPLTADKVSLYTRLPLTTGTVASSVKWRIEEGEVLVRLVVLLLAALAAGRRRWRRRWRRRGDVNRLVKDRCASALRVGWRREYPDAGTTLDGLIGEGRE